ncbi:hypothetical protein [Patulibacter americanus]|uniref:hypothetical protein n=1 Tax=Patulibacter americanus TaxID=588672 RepID=UPI00040F28ED|nr:hypothetical protein [Patulibacter americanus]
MSRTTLLRAAATAGATATLALLGASSASATVVTCDTDTYDTQSPNALSAMTSVTSARGLSCGQALRVVRRNARKAGMTAYREGGRFRLGAYRCTNTFHENELYLARCVRGGKAFRLNYGS